ncbi:MAG TPA: sucrase ferredoxin [Lapillicoccus sp.]|nr:sucrase ferredoxin [Lapillicoccus sp.]
MEWDQASDETLYGTAAPARFWVAVEQNGPWGRTAATQSYLPADVGDELTRACRAAGGRLGLIRRPGEHADPRTGPRLCYLAWTGPDAFLLVGRVDSPDDLLRLPLAALAVGDRDAVHAALPQFRPSEPIFLVCTNGRHDVCCAIRGRPVALAGHERYPGRVWECSHTGGHRFSPTGVLLPWGRTLGRLDVDAVGEVLESADLGDLPFGMLGPRHDRGSSAYSPRVQVGESAVRDEIGETDLDALTAVESGRLEVQVSHRDGRQWTVALSVVEGPPRRNSCGEPEEVARTWTAAVSERPRVDRHGLATS